MNDVLGIPILSFLIFFPLVGGLGLLLLPKSREGAAKTVALVVSLVEFVVSLGLYGENDQRVNATIPRADSTMKAIGGTFVSRTYTGAGHGFLRQQDNAANAVASRQAWPETIAWFRKYLE